MKHHKVKGLWSHMPDRVPIEDAPSTGPKRKKAAISKRSKKHLWDLLRQEYKELLRAGDSLVRHGIPAPRVPGASLVGGFFMGLFDAEQIVRKADRMDVLMQELESRG